MAKKVKTYIDKNSGLEWATSKSPDPEAWSDAMNFPKDHLEDTGFHIPTVHEFITLIDYSKKNSVFKTGLPFKGSDLYWVSDQYAHNPKNVAWTVDMETGSIYPSGKSNRRFVLCVKKAK